MFKRIFGGNKASGDPPELRNEIAKAMQGLSAVTAMHQSTWHLGEANWNLNQDVGDLVFTVPGRMRAVAPAQIIGTYDTQDGSWLWGWDHPSVESSLARHARQVLAYGQERGYARLTTRKFQCSQDEAWEMTALAFMLCNANGAYRGPAGSALVYMTFGEVQLSKASGPKSS